MIGQKKHTGLPPIQQLLKAMEASRLLSKEREARLASLRKKLRRNNPALFYQNRIRSRKRPPRQREKSLRLRARLRKCRPPNVKKSDGNFTISVFRLKN